MSDREENTELKLSFDQTVSGELLREGSKLIIACPTSLVAFAHMDTLGIHEIYMRNFANIFIEYDSLFNAIEAKVGSENMLVIETFVTGGSIDSDLTGKTDIDLSNPDLIVMRGPDFVSEKYNVVDYPLIKNKYKSWPKNAFSNPNGKLLLNKAAWSEDIGAPQFEGIGDGGRILSLVSSNVVFVGELIKENYPDEIEFLKSQGLKVGVLPQVDPEGREAFPPTDIDGFSLLVSNGDEVFLYVAKSYANQSKAINKIKKATRKTGVTLRIIDDSNLSHLSFNAVVFDNGEIIVAEEYDSTLVTQLALDLGQDKLTVIPPLKTISKFAGGGAGCLTNILPNIN